MRLKHLITFDPLKSDPNSKYVPDLESFAALALDPPAVTLVFSEQLLNCDEFEWKRFLDTYFLYQANRLTALPIDLDFVDRSRLSDYSFESARVEYGPNQAPTKPLYSFIIPFRDRDDTLPTVIEKIGALDGPEPFEVVLVNDGSHKPLGPKATMALQRTQASWKLIHLPPSKYFRAGFARNVGAHHAEGGFLVFTDSDILLKPDFLMDLTVQFKSADFIQAKRWQVWRDEREGAWPPRTEEPNPFWADFYRAPQAWHEVDQPWRYASTYCLAMRRADFVKMGGFRLWYSKYGFEDTDLGDRAHRLGLRFQLSNSDVFHLSPLVRKEAFKTPVRHKASGRMRESARKYFVLNEACGSLNWLTHMML